MTDNSKIKPQTPNSYWLILCRPELAIEQSKPATGTSAFIS
jgi:hypothetical protein